MQEAIEKRTNGEGARWGGEEMGGRNSRADAAASERVILLLDSGVSISALFFGETGGEEEARARRWGSGGARKERRRARGGESRAGVETAAEGRVGREL